MASTDTPKCILLKGDPLYGEANVAAGQTVVPGELLSHLAAGTVQRHGVAVATTFNEPLMVAREEEYVGGSIDTPYAAGDRCPYMILRPGDEWYGIAAGAIAAGAFVEFAAAGRVDDTVIGPSRVAQALTAATNPGDRVKLRAI